jgi:16S rRNA C1402 N4-methylase RsmH
MWCNKEGRMMVEPYHSMTDDSVRAHLKDQMKKAGDDGIKSMFDDIMFVKSS